MKKKGLIQIYTGDGKGKTTAAIGLAIRATAYDLKVGYIYFHKNPKRWKYSEHKILKKLGIKVFGLAKKHPHFSKKVSSEKIRQECLKGLKLIKKSFKENYDMLILDEINISLRDGFLKEEEIMEILKIKPPYLELILTGRGATQKLIEKADLVSEIKKIKHPYDFGIRKRKGIEF